MGMEATCRMEPEWVQKWCEGSGGGGKGGMTRKQALRKHWHIYSTLAYDVARKEWLFQ